MIVYCSEEAHRDWTISNPRPVFAPEIKMERGGAMSQIVRSNDVPAVTENEICRIGK